MAAQNIGPRIKIDGYAQYKKDMDNILSATKNLKSEQGLLAAKYTDATKAAEKYKDQQNFLNGAIANQEKALETNKKMLEKVKKEYGEDSTEANKYKKAVNDTETELEELRKQLKEIPSDGQIFRDEIAKQSEAIQTMGGKIQDAGKAISGVGSSLSMYVTAPLVAAGGAAVTTIVGFEKVMSKVQALSGVGSDDLETLSDKARELGSTTAFTAEEVGEGMSYMALAGWNSEQMLAGIAPILNLAAASGEDLGVASDIVTDALTAFGLSAEDTSHFVDVLATASANSNTTVSGLGEAFKFVAPVAGAMGYSIDDVSVALGLMANAGIKGSQAGTTLRTTISRLASPTKATAKTMEELGIAIKDENGEIKPLSVLLGDLREAFAGLSKEEAIAAASSLVGKNAMSGFLSLVQTGDEDVDNLTKAVQGADGAAQNMADTMLNNTAGALTIAKSAISEAAMAAGEALAPFVKDAADKVGELASMFSNLDKPMQDTIIKIGLVAAATGPLLVGVGNVMSAVGGLVSFVGAHPLGALLALGGVAIGWAATQIAITNTASRTSELTVETDKLRKSISDVNTNLGNVKTNLDNETKSAETNAAAAGVMISALDELTKKENLSNSEKALMVEYVNTLNEMYPEMNLQIDETGTKLNKTTEEMWGYVRSMEAAAKAEAYKDAYVDAVKQQVQAQANVNKAEKQYNAVMEKSGSTLKSRKLLQAQVTGLTEDMGQAEKQLSGLLADGTITQEDYNSALDAMGKGEVNVEGETLSLSKAQDKLIKSEGNNIAETNGVRKAMDEAQASLDECNSTVDELKSAYEKSVIEMAEAKAETEKIESATDNATEAFAETKKAVDDNRNAYQKLDEAQAALAKTFMEKVDGLTGGIQKALDSQMNMFEEFNKGTEISKEELLKNMQSQIEGVQNWEKNIDLLMKRGINEDVLQRLMEMGPQGSGYVEAFVSMSDEELAQAGEMWSQSLDIKGMSDKWGEQLKTDAATSVANGMEGVTDVMKTVGAKSPKAFADGVAAHLDDLEGVGEDVEEAVDGEFDEEAFYSIGTTAGEQIPKGVSDGIESPASTAKAKAAAKKAAELYTIDGLADVGEKAGKELTQGVANGMANDIKQDYVKSQKKGLILAATPSGMKAAGETAGKDLAQGTANGLANDTKKGYVKSGANTLKSAATPSGMKAVGETAGKDVAQGMANGEGNQTKLGYVKSAASNLKTAGTPTGMYSSGYDVGNNMSSGFIQGIKDKLQNIKDAAAQAAQSAIDKMKNLFDSHSPSRVMMELGHNVGEGFVIGLTAESSAIESAVTDTFDLGMLGAASGAHGAGSVSNSTAVNITVNGAPGQDVHELADIIEEKIAFNLRNREAAFA